MAFGLDADWASIQVKNHPIRQRLLRRGNQGQIRLQRLPRKRQQLCVLK